MCHFWYLKHHVSNSYFVSTRWSYKVASAKREGDSCHSSTEGPQAGQGSLPFTGPLCSHLQVPCLAPSHAPAGHGHLARAGRGTEGYQSPPPGEREVVGKNLRSQAPSPPQIIRLLIPG